MLEGLEYHHTRLKQMEKKMLTDVFSYMAGGGRKSKLGSSYVHEIRAYLNVIGQFVGCITSDWFSKNYVDKSQLSTLCPTVLALLPFRHKDAAHRCIDKPEKRMKEETDSQKESFSSLYCDTEWTGQHSKPCDLTDEIPLLEQSLATDLHLSYHAKIAVEHRCPILNTYNVAPVAGIEYPVSSVEIWLSFIPVKQHFQIMTEAYATIKAAFQIKRQP